MAHKFDIKKMNKLDNPQRRLEMPPRETLESLEVKESDIFIDIGCGIGYFTLEARKLINEMNSVYGLDTSIEMLEELKRRQIESGLEEVKTVLTKEYKFPLENETGTYALISNVLHEIDDKGKFIKEIRRVLKRSGKIAVIEWKKEEMDQGPPINHRISEEEILEIFRGSLCSLIKKIEIGNKYIGMVFQTEE